MIVVFFLNDMTLPFGFQPLAVVASLLNENQNGDYIYNHNSNGNECFSTGSMWSVKGLN